MIYTEQLSINPMCNHVYSIRRPRIKLFVTHLTRTVTELKRRKTSTSINHNVIIPLYLPPTYLSFTFTNSHTILIPNKFILGQTEGIKLK